MGALEGRVAIITGAGRGLGREHALLFAAEGAKVVVNDRGGANDGSGADATPADEVVAEITAGGGEAIANSDDVADFEGAQRMVNAAIDAFGDLDILVNNAGILRDRVLINMSEAEWDDVVRVHLKGHFAPSRWAAAYWREEAKAGRAKPRNIVHTSSTSGLFANPGQSNYGAAKTGIATFSQIIAKELARYEVKSNCIAPGARTRLTLATPGLDEIMEAKEGAFDDWDPANVSPLVCYLSTADCAVHGRDVLRAGPHGQAGPLVGDGRDGRERRPLGRRGARRRPHVRPDVSRRAAILRSTRQADVGGHRPGRGLEQRVVIGDHVAGLTEQLEADRAEQLGPRGERAGERVGRDRADRIVAEVLAHLVEVAPQPARERAVGRCQPAGGARRRRRHRGAPATPGWRARSSARGRDSPAPGSRRSARTRGGGRAPTS